MTIHYINLSNGVDLLRDFPDVDYRFVRIQSTACEQKRWDFILHDLDYDLLLNLAIGNTCVIHDGNAKGTPRALWQGVEWVRYALSRKWLGLSPKAAARGNDCSGYFDTAYRKRISKPTSTKLEYFRKLLLTDEIRLETSGFITTNDGQYGHFRDVLSALQKTRGAA